MDSMLAEKLRVNGLLLQLKRSYNFFVKVLIETNVKISKELQKNKKNHFLNEFHFSDAYCCSPCF